MGGRFGQEMLLSIFFIFINNAVGPSRLASYTMN